MKTPKSNNRWLLWVIASSIPIVFVLKSLFLLSTAVTTACVVIACLLLATVAIWQHANRQATGDEWWQDDDPSGWRGY